MTEQELLQMRNLAEDGKVQFKERITDKYDISCEMVAFSNSRGGRLIIGVNDKSGIINALSYKELQETANPRKAAKQNLKIPKTEIRNTAAKNNIFTW